MAAAAILDFQIFEFLTQNGQEVQATTLYQILWWSVKPLLRYGDFSIFFLQCFDAVGWVAGQASSL